ncbi:unnamed protein product [Soboliphyme baturini]|uniref:Uncharacterized protein n=1 Tax=Soboliphyme baturini TaxID=241478 RepID=A0A183IIT8_9BILA|nr:unnamed protein product [Soboliphyme baturini]
MFYSSPHDERSTAAEDTATIFRKQISHFSQLYMRLLASEFECLSKARTGPAIAGVAAVVASSQPLYSSPLVLIGHSAPGGGRLPIINDEPQGRSVYVRECDQKMKRKPTTDTAAAFLPRLGFSDLV